LLWWGLLGVMRSAPFSALVRFAETAFGDPGMSRQVTVCADLHEPVCMKKVCYGRSLAKAVFDQ
jgi:hypothetical protein